MDVQVARKADERDLFQFFSDSGKVVDVRIIKDAQSRKSKGIAYVEFEKQVRDVSISLSMHVWIPASTLAHCLREAQSPPS